jgi:hypothetical protein
MDDEHRTLERTQGLTAERLARNDAIFRSANEQIRQAAEEHEFEARVPFVCECAEAGCRELVRLTLAEYASVRRLPRQFLNARGHEDGAEGSCEVVATHPEYVVVAKVGRAGEVAEQLEGSSSPASAPVDGDGRVTGEG